MISGEMLGFISFSLTYRAMALNGYRKWPQEQLTTPLSRFEWLAN